jgi:hypothetical protein
MSRLGLMCLHFRILGLPPSHPAFSAIALIPGGMVFDHFFQPAEKKGNGS